MNATAGTVTFNELQKLCNRFYSILSFIFVRIWFYLTVFFSFVASVSFWQNIRNVLEIDTMIEKVRAPWHRVKYDAQHTKTKILSESEKQISSRKMFSFFFALRSLAIFCLVHKPRRANERSSNEVYSLFSPVCWRLIFCFYLWQLNNVIYPTRSRTEYEKRIEILAKCRDERKSNDVDVDRWLISEFMRQPADQTFGVWWWLMTSNEICRKLLKSLSSCQCKSAKRFSICFSSFVTWKCQYFR